MKIKLSPLLQDIHFMVKSASMGAPASQREQVYCAQLALRTKDYKLTVDQCLDVLGIAKSSKNINLERLAKGLGLPLQQVKEAHEKWLEEKRKEPV